MKFLFIFILVALILSDCSTQEPDIKSQGKSTKKTASIQKQSIVKEGKEEPQKSRSQVKELPNHLFKGTWVVEGSSAEFEIDFRNGKVLLSGKDHEDKEGFGISRTNWNNLTLSSSIRMPSTGHTLNIKLIVVDENVLRCEFTGDAVGEAIWRRKESVN
ncbi:hypothetical protein KJ966_25930 [bacterium]|nr:hypothetical protein [bacterium]